MRWIISWNREVWWSLNMRPWDCNYRAEGIWGRARTDEKLLKCSVKHCWIKNKKINPTEPKGKSLHHELLQKASRLSPSTILLRCCKKKKGISLWLLNLQTSRTMATNIQQVRRMKNFKVFRSVLTSYCMKFWISVCFLVETNDWQCIVCCMSKECPFENTCEHHVYETCHHLASH